MKEQRSTASQAEALNGVNPDETLKGENPKAEALKGVNLDRTPNPLKA